MTDREHALVAAQQFARVEKMTPAQREALFDRVEAAFVRVGDHDPEPRQRTLERVIR